MHPVSSRTSHGRDSRELTRSVAHCDGRGSVPAYYDCKHCSRVHELPGHFPTRELFETVPLHQHVCTCPVADQGAIYRDRDVFWREGRGSERPIGDEGVSAGGEPKPRL